MLRGVAVLNQRRVALTLAIIGAAPASISGTVLVYRWLDAASEHDLMVVVVVLLSVLIAVLLCRWIVWPWLVGRDRDVER